MGPAVVHATATGAVRCSKVNLEKPFKQHKLDVPVKLCEFARKQPDGELSSVPVALWWPHLVAAGSQFSCGWEIEINVVFLDPFRANCGSKRCLQHSRLDIAGIFFFPFSRK